MKEGAVEETVDQDARPCLAGRYRLGSVLGTGGMSVVHEGFDERLQRPVAVKCLKPEMAARADVRSRFETEARWAARLTHPHAVAVYDTGDDDGVPFMVMERLPGETLAAGIATGPVTDVAWLRRVAVEVLGALGAAHECGIVHRDVKPGNILLTSSGHAKVADFGIAKSLGLDDGSDRRDLTHTGQLIGTPSYLAPERLDGATATAQSDLWSLGVVLYEALAGRKPVLGDDPIAVAYAVKHEDPPPLATLRPDAPADLVAAIERALDRDPSRRWGSAREMAAALRRAAPTDTPSAAAAAAAATVIGPAPDATLVGSGPSPTLVGVPAGAPVPAPAARPAARRRRFQPSWLLLPLGLLLIVLLAAFVAARDDGNVPAPLADGGGGSGEQADPAAAALAADLRDVAERVEFGDGSRGPEVARRLREIAAIVASGGDAGDRATSLLRDAVAWNDDGRQLLDTATSLTVDALKRVPGVDAAAAEVVVDLSPPAVDIGDEGDGEGDGKGNGKDKGKGDD